MEEGEIREVQSPVRCVLFGAELSHALFSFWSTKQGGQFVAAAFARRIVEALAQRARF